MPLYEYQCKKCHHRFEKIQKFSDPHIKKCPECGGAVEQMISAPAVQFKGSGWYVTDYGKNTSHAPKSANGDKGEKKESKPEEKSKSEDTAKSDDKPKSEDKSSKKKTEKK